MKSLQINTHSPHKQLVELQNEFFGIDNNLDNQEFLVFISDLHHFSIEGANLTVFSYLGLDPGIAQEKNTNVFQNIIYPEDYPDFRNYLESLKSLNPGEEKEIKIRIKDQAGDYNWFLFKHRLYTARKNSLLGIAKKAKPHPPEFPKKDYLETEKALNASRNKFKSLVNSIDDGFCSVEMIFDLQKKPIDYLFLETNPVFEKQVKIPNAEGKSMKECEPNHEDYWFEGYGKVALTGIPMRFQNLAEKLNNIWYDVYAFPLSEKKSGRIGIIFSNVTQWKQTQDRLKKSNFFLEKKVLSRTLELEENSEMLQTIFDTTNEGIMVLKPIYNDKDKIADFVYLRVNKVILKQYQREELEGTFFLDVNEDSKEIGVFEKLQHSMITGESQDFEVLYEQNGFSNWFRITARRQNDLLIASMEDITIRKKESQKLKETLRFKRQLTKTSPDIIIIFNLYEEKITYLNRDMSPQPGMRQKEILGMPLLNIISFIHPREREKGMEFHNNLMQASDKEILELEFRLRVQSGKWEWYNALGKVFARNRKGNVCEYMLLLRNIDKHKNTQRALSNAERLSIKGEIAHTLAHELRNPLASIGMATDVLQAKMTKAEDAQNQNYTKIIKRSAKILNNLITDLLTSSNYSPTKLEKNSLANILEESLGMATDRIYLSGILVKKEYKGPYYINADEEKLKIALLNIIVNACEAMKPQEGILELHIYQENGDYVLSIKDNGCGLEKEQLEKLFDAFYTQKSGGVGVGLSSVKNILEEHDAKIKVESEPNKGTHFLVSFHCYES